MNPYPEKSPVHAKRRIPAVWPVGVRPVALCYCLGVVAARSETLTVQNQVVGTTPAAIGYNLGHFMQDSNAADWFRYSGVKAARIFISVSEIEPTDDLAPVGDGVASEAAFFNRRSLLRANAASPTAALNNSYVNWSVFTAGYASTSFGNNKLRYSHVLGTLRDQGVAVLANITASPSRFPITGSGDWAGRWELWQHYYAQAFLLSRDYGVVSFSMFNEPNGWTGMTDADWLVRYRFCSDAIQSAIADMNARYGKNLVPRVFAPNTANGAEKYNTPGADTWGRDAVENRHLMLDGSSQPGWMNLHVYNYQKYTHRLYAEGGLSGFINDHDLLRGFINADTPGEPPLPMALTEFNVRTGALYDTLTETQDSPFDYSALGANCVALTGCGISQLYLFKFGQTASNSFYGIAKNGTHYVENASGSGYNYGGATRCAEVFRLFNKAAEGAKPRLNFSTTPGAGPVGNGGVWSMVTYDAQKRAYHVFVANKETSAVPLEVDFSALPVPAGNPFFIEEVSATCSGGIVRLGNLEGGKVTSSDLPAQAVWLVTVPSDAKTMSATAAVADTRLGDGSSKTLAGGSVGLMQVRSDGTANGRGVALIRIPVPTGDAADIHSVLLEMNVATSAGTDPVQVHVYGVTDNSWAETTATWASSTSFIKQNVAAGNRIRNNIVASPGTTTRMLGQLLADSPDLTNRRLDVTDFVRSSADGYASFLVVQDHRWDVAQPELTSGDTQSAGLVVASRESAEGGARLVAITTPPASGLAVVAREANIRGGMYASTDVDEAANGYLMVKYDAGLHNARKAYFQFDLPATGVDLDAAATFRLTFNNTFAQQVQLWGLNQPYPEFNTTMTWNTAAANNTANNGMLTSGNPSATAMGADVRISPGSALTPFSFTLPRLGDHVSGNRLTLVLSAVDHPSNASGGLRIALGSATLSYGVLSADTSWNQWRKLKFGAEWENEAISGATADWDQDGISNLLEYALGGEPLVAGTDILPRLAKLEDGVEFRFSRGMSHSDIRISVQASASLDEDWAEIAASTNGNPFIALVEGVEVGESAGGQVILTDRRSGDPGRFMRLKVELPSP